MNKEVRKLIKWAEANGWHFVRRTSTGHIMLRHDTGVSVTMASTPSDPRAIRNARSDMQRELRAVEEGTRMQRLRKHNP